MVAKIEGFLSREELGMRPPDRVSYSITPQNGGAAVHWGGPRQSNATLDQCIRTWLAWQNYHMGPGGLGTKDGANDIAYNAAFNNFGMVFAGRGLGVRSGAQGSNYGNQNFHAFVWIGGSGQEPNELAFDALDWLILEARNEYKAGRQVSPHSRFNWTTCPGPDFVRFAATRHNRDIPTVSDFKPQRTWMENIMDNLPTLKLIEPMRRGLDVRRLQGLLVAHGNAPENTIRPNGTLDGVFGPGTEASVKEFQSNYKLAPDGIVGPNTWEALLVA